MAKLVDIKGYWNMTGGRMFIESDMWEGKILLEDDGWFEGIVHDPYSPYTKDRFVFGIFHPTKIIELIKVSPANVSDPFVFRVQRTVNGYEGEFSVIGFFNERYCGASLINTAHVEYLKEINHPEVEERDIEKEKEELAERIANFKQNNDYKELYENTIGMRDNLSQYVLGKYNGVEWTEEEIESFLEPVSDQVREDTIDAAKKFVKEMKPIFFDDDDLPDELPF